MDFIHFTMDIHRDLVFLDSKIYTELSSRKTELSSRKIVCANMAKKHEFLARVFTVLKNYIKCFV